MWHRYCIILDITNNIMIMKYNVYLTNFKEGNEKVVEVKSNNAFNALEKAENENNGYFAFLAKENKEEKK